jgi:hypothetical protein
MISRHARSLAAFVVFPAVAVSGAMTMRPLTAADNRQAPNAAVTAQSKALYSEKCSACHNLPDPLEKGYTRAEWQRTVDKMLTKYGASDSISPAEASQIVDYLATFAPRAGAAAKPLDRWATDGVDVWTADPAQTAVTNFESPEQLGRLRQIAAGANGPKSVWKIGADGDAADGHTVRVTAPGAPAGRFAMLLDPRVNGHDIDVSVRFRIDSGKASPAAGIAFGIKDSKNYQLIRYDAANNTLSLMQIQEPVHQTLQKTDIATGADALAPPAVPPAAGAAEPSLGQWHKLRVLVHGTTIRAWIDMTKRISIDSGAVPDGEVALWTQGDTAASFDDWTSDVYDKPAQATASAPV